MISYNFNEWQYSGFEREGGHMVVRVSVFTSGINVSSIELIFDTGAFVTVLSRPTARKIGLPLGSGQSATLRGFSRKHDIIFGELVEIPRLMLGKHFIYDVKVVAPLDDVDVAEVLGENVLEYMNYTVDHDKDIIFFQANPNPKPYKNKEKGIDLSCGNVLLSTDYPQFPDTNR